MNRITFADQTIRIARLAQDCWPVIAHRLHDRAAMELRPRVTEPAQLPAACCGAIVPTMKPPHIHIMLFACLVSGCTSSNPHDKPSCATAQSIQRSERTSEAGWPPPSDAERAQNKEQREKRGK
jgi:hypothetical protein